MLVICGKDYFLLLKKLVK